MGQLRAIENVALFGNDAADDSDTDSEPGAPHGGGGASDTPPRPRRRWWRGRHCREAFFALAVCAFFAVIGGILQAKARVSSWLFKLLVVGCVWCSTGIMCCAAGLFAVIGGVLQAKAKVGSWLIVCFCVCLCCVSFMVGRQRRSMRHT